jgi:hypothetical protein
MKREKNGNKIGVMMKGKNTEIMKYSAGVISNSVLLSTEGSTGMPRKAARLLAHHFLEAFGFSDNST